MVSIVHPDNDEAKIAIDSLEVIEGRLPRRALGLVLDWAELHREELRQLEQGTRAPTAQSDSAAGVMRMFRITDVKAGPGYTLEVTFADGASGKIDLSARLFGPIFEPLRDPALFSQVQVDEYGAVCWPNGADLAPDALYKKISSGVGPRTVLAS